MSPRERVLAFIVGASVFVFLNIYIGDAFFKKRTQLRGELAQNTGALAAMQRQLGEKPMWDQREAWLQARQPRLASEDTAGVVLLDLVKEVAKKDSVQIVTQSLRVPAYQPEYNSISVDLETTSTWAALFAFLRDVQGPDKFVVFESATLKKDDKDETQMRGNFKIAKWFAPKAKPK
jgi:hypothetical protein